MIDNGLTSKPLSVTYTCLVLLVVEVTNLEGVGACIGWKEILPLPTVPLYTVVPPLANPPSKRRRISDLILVEAS